jgi:hypothetical protein
MCHYAECRFAESRYAECRSAMHSNLFGLFVSIKENKRFILKLGDKVIMIFPTLLIEMSK